MPRTKKDEPVEGKDASKKPKKSKKELLTVTGMRDILPQDQKYWRAATSAAERVANDYGYGRIDTPVVEYTDVFVRGIGKQTDIVEKEMYAFTDQGGDSLALRPEGTASIVRAYVQHGMVNQIQPVKFFYNGPLFRHDKPQSGRYRQFYQIGYEAIGESSPALDAQLILMGWNILNDLGLESVIQVNSIGCPECREEYKKALVKYYKLHSKGLCDNCQKRLARNPLRLLDCKEEGCEKFKSEAPQILDYLDDDCKKHFMKVIEYLDELDLPYVLNAQVVRGLDYYSKTIFEYWSADDAEGKTALGGGGRYDGLVEMLGGRGDTPACGLAMGLDRIVAKLREKEITVPEIYQPEIFVAQLGEAAKKKAFVMYEKLRRKGFKLSQAFHKDNLKGQLEMANKSKVKFTLIIGQKEIGDDTVLVRDMDGGIQETVAYGKIESDLAKRIERWRTERLEKFTVDESQPMPTAPKSKRHKSDELESDEVHSFSDDRGSGKSYQDFGDFNDSEDY